jgi:hypothetical protein
MISRLPTRNTRGLLTYAQINGAVLLFLATAAPIVDLPLLARQPLHLNVVVHTDPFTVAPGIFVTDTPPLARVGRCPVAV